MTISMYNSSIPVFIRHLKNLSAILNKAASYAELKKIDPSFLINDRIAPDMLPFVRQIQIVSDTAKSGAARLAGVEVPSFEDNETTFSQLQERLTKTVTFLQSLTVEQIDGSEERKINYTQRGKERNFIGQPFLLNYILPNFYFHITIAYAILRHDGLDIGKKDFLGEV